MSFKIAIDGPAGAGKSTIAKLLAKRLNIVYVDTGAMYRAIGLFCLQKNIDIEDEEKINDYIDDIEVEIIYDNGNQQVILNGCNVSDDIRTEQVSWAASTTCKYARVREKMVSLQRKLAEKTDVVMDGRDIGSVVLPNAELKIFLTASPEVRAQRRYLENCEKNISCSYEEILENIKKRDLQDTTRQNSPLVQVEDAILLDSSDMTIDEVTAEIMKLVEERKK